MKKEYSSFRDPSGFIFSVDNYVFRQVNNSYKAQYDHLMNSGLYENLVTEQLLVDHKPIDLETNDPNKYMVIQPAKINFISYPYEWSFSQLKDAALTTLKIHKCALKYGMILKDASAYNIQFFNGVPKLIDTLSFDFYHEGTPWIAYGQFCRHFLAPLMLMANIDIRLSQLMRIYIDGIPIDLASKLLKGKGGFSAKQHIHWHARAISKYSQDGKVLGKTRNVHINKFNYVALIDSLISTVQRITLKGVVTEWMDYYNNTNYSDTALKSKEKIVSSFFKLNDFNIVWDLGANDGRFSRMALENGASLVISFDLDAIAVEKNYQLVKKYKNNILPLLLDLTNPSPGLGFANRERLSIEERQKPDCIVALALIHHLAISNNAPFEKIAEWFALLSDNLIIEFVPKEDSQVQVLIATRDDIFLNYTKSEFEKAFQHYFDFIRSENILNSERVIYHLRKKREHE